MTAQAAHADVPVTLGEHSWNTLDPERAADLAAEARALPGLAHSTADGGFFIAARYADVVGVHDMPQQFASGPSVFRPFQGAPSFPALEMDGEEHEVWRQVFRELVTPRTIKRITPQVRDDVDRHIDAFIANGEADLIAQLAEHVPVETICRVGGIEDMDVAEEIRVRARAALEAGGRDAVAFNRHIVEFGEYVLPLVAERRANPQDDFISHIGTVELNGARLDDVSIRGALFGLFAAGHHSTTSAMSSLFANVLSRPEVLAKLRAEQRLIPIAIEESLRLSPPFYGFYRRVAEDTTLAGTPMLAGDNVLVNWFAANHDAAQFDDPDAFRLDRLWNRHVAFGWRAHLCIGAPLARMELKIALEQVLARLPDIALVNAPRYHFGGAGATYLDAVRERFTPVAPSVQ